MHNVTRQSTFDLYNRLTGGELRKTLKRRRAAGVSYVDIAHELRSEGVVTVDPGTIRRWCIQEGIAA